MARLQQMLPENPPQNTEYFLGIWPQLQDQSIAYAQRPYDGPDAKLVQIELINGSILSGYEAYDYTNFYTIPTNLIDIEARTPPDIYYIGQTSEDVQRNVGHFAQVLPF